MTTKPRIAITLDDELYAKLEDFRFAQRFNTKSEATAALIKYALKAIEEGEVDASILREREKV